MGDRSLDTRFAQRAEQEGQNLRRREIGVLSLPFSSSYLLCAKQASSWRNSCDAKHVTKPANATQRVELPPGKEGLQPEASLAWWAGNRPCEA